MTTVIVAGATSALTNSSRGLSVVIGAFASTTPSLRLPVELATSSTPLPGTTLQETCIAVVAVVGPAAPFGLADAPSIDCCSQLYFQTSITPVPVTSKVHPLARFEKSRQASPRRPLPTVVPIALDRGATM